MSDPDDPLAWIDRAEQDFISVRRFGRKYFGLR